MQLSNVCRRHPSVPPVVERSDTTGDASKDPGIPAGMPDQASEMLTVSRKSLDRFIVGLPSRERIERDRSSILTDRGPVPTGKE